MASWHCPGCRKTLNGDKKPALDSRCCPECEPKIGAAMKAGKGRMYRPAVARAKKRGRCTKRGAKKG